MNIINKLVERKTNKIGNKRKGIEKQIQHTIKNITIQHFNHIKTIQLAYMTFL